MSCLNSHFMWPAENLNEKKVCLNVRSIEKIKCNLSISCKTLLSLTQFPSKQIDVLRSTDRDVMRLGLVDGKRLATASTRKKKRSRAWAFNKFSFRNPQQASVNASQPRESIRISTSSPPGKLGWSLQKYEFLIEKNGWATTEEGWLFFCWYEISRKTKTQSHSLIKNRFKLKKRFRVNKIWKKLLKSDGLVFWLSPFGFPMLCQII